MSNLTRWISWLCLVGLVVVTGSGCTGKLKTAYHEKRAHKYYAEGKYDQAEIEYKNVLKHDRQNVEAWANLGFIYADEGRINDSFYALTRADQLATNNVPVRMKLGALYLTQGKVKEARSEASFVLAQDPHDPKAPILLAGTATTNQINETRQQLQSLAQKGKTAPLEVALGTLAFHERDLKAAETFFREAIKLDPKFSDAYSALANVYVARKDFTNAGTAFKQAMELAPPRSGKALFYAQFKILTGDPKAAKTVLENLVKQAPDYLPAWMALAQLAAAEKDFSGGISLLGNVFSRDPMNLEALLLKGRLERENRQPALAIKDLQMVVKHFPNVPLAYCLLAQAQADNNDFDDATVNLNQAIKLSPNYADAILLLAQIQIYQEKLDPAVASLQQLILQQPQSVPARLLLASAYRTRGGLDGAIQIYQELQRAQPKNPEMYQLLGVTYLQQQKISEARTQFETALKLEPDYLPALEQLVNLDLAEKQFTEAGRRVQQQINQHTNSPPLQCLQALVQATSGDTNQAEISLKKIIVASPDYIPAYMLLANMYVLDKENQKALAEWSAAVAKNPKNIEALRLMGQTYAAERDYDRARDSYEKVLAVTPDDAAAKKNPNYVIALNNLAWIYAENFGNLDKGEQLARQARELVPEDPSTADTLGWILYRKGQYLSALPLLSQSAASQVADPEVAFHLGMAYYQTGDEANARTALHRALQLNPNFPDHAECDQCLKVLAIDPRTADHDAKSWLEQRVKNHPLDPVAQLRLAAIYQRTGNTDPAITAYEAALKLSPQNIPVMLKLVDLYAAKDPQKALNTARTAYQASPNDPEVTHALARMAFLTGDYAWSLNLLQLTSRNQPQNPEVFYDLGRAFYSVGKVSDARTSMTDALQVGGGFPHAEEARTFLALAALTNNPAQVQGLETLADSILKTNADYVPALMVRGAMTTQKLDFAAAQKTYETVLDHYPDFAPAQKDLLMLYLKNPKNDAKAAALAAKARQSLPGDPEVAKALGIIVYRQGDFNRAAGLLDEAGQQLSRDAEVLYFQGMTQYQLKNNAKCKTYLQKALSLNLADPQAADAKKILAQLN